MSFMLKEERKIRLSEHAS